MCANDAGPAGAGTGAGSIFGVLGRGLIIAYEDVMFAEAELALIKALTLGGHEFLDLEKQCFFNKQVQLLRDIVTVNQ